MSVSTNRPQERHDAGARRHLFQVVEFQHVKPGKGRCLRPHEAPQRPTRCRRGQDVNAGVKVGLAIVERKEMQFLYADGTDLVFMNLQDYGDPRLRRRGRSGSYINRGRPGDYRHPVRSVRRCSVDLAASMTSR